MLANDQYTGYMVHLMENNPIINLTFLQYDIYSTCTYECGYIRPYLNI